MKPTVLAGRFAALLLVSVALVATHVHANQSTNPPKWWTSEPYKRELGLTPDQSRKLEDIFQAAAPTLRTQRKTLDDAEAQFEKLVNQDNEPVVIEQINRVVSARAEPSIPASWMLPFVVSTSTGPRIPRTSTPPFTVLPETVPVTPRI